MTDRRQVEDALRQREAVIARQLAELEAIYQHAPIGLCVFDRELRYLRINERLAEMNGIPAAAHIGRTVREIVPDLADTLEGFARRVLETGEPVRDLPLSGETALAPGIVRHWLEQWYPLFDATGAIVGLNVVVEEVTERRQAEVRLAEVAAAERTARQRVERLQALTAALAAADSADAVATVLVDEGMAATCATTATVVMRERDGLVDHGDHARLAHQRGLPDDVIVAFARFPVSGAGSASLAMRTGAAVFVEERDGADGIFARFPSTRALWERLGEHALAAVPLLQDGIAIGALSLTYDAPRRFDEAERTFFETLGTQAVQALTRAESRAAERTARDRAEMLQRVTARLASADTPQDVSRFFSEELTALVAADTAWVGHVTADGTAVEALGWAGYAPDTVARWHRMPLDAGAALTEVVRRGEPEWWETQDALVAAYPARQASIRAAGQKAVAVIPLFEAHASAGARVTGGMVIGFRRPTRFDAATRTFYVPLAQQCAQALERTRLFAAERQARSDAEAASRAKGDFLANMSHELRTPLNAIAGHVQLMEMGLHGPVTPAQAEALGRVQHAGRHLLGLINDVLNYAKLEAGRVEYELRDVDLRQVLERTLPLVEPQRLAKGLLLDLEHPPAPVVARCDEEKVSQVLLNLLSNAVKFTPAGGRITVRSVVIDGAAHLEVADTGIGIAADRLESIFEPFVQVLASRARGHEGTGLGLTISRDLARGMGGDLTVASEPGAGSRFVLRLPLAGG